MIGVVLVLTAVGGLVARSIYQPAASASTPAAAPPPTTNASTSGTPSPDPTSSQVKLSSDAASSPYGSSVLDLLQAYYNAINGDSYEGWEQTVTANFVQTIPQPNWESGYKSTEDRGMYVYRINSAPGGQLRVLITFTSRQAVSKAPKSAPYSCIDWNSVLTVVNTRDGLRIDNGSAGGYPITTECASG